MNVAFQVVQDFHRGKSFVTAEGRRVIEMYELIRSPARIDGGQDDETLAVRLEGESEADGLTPYDHRDLKYA